MGNEKDRLGDKLHDKERGEEDKYFSEREKELLERQRKARKDAAAAPPLHCPKDGHAMVARSFHGVTVDECPTCHGMWLNHHEIDAAARRERDSWFGRVIFGSGR